MTTQLLQSGQLQRLDIHMAQTMIFPPQTQVEPVTELLHGVTITDPYRWLEDQDSPVTRNWLEEQTNYTRAYLNSVQGRDRIRERVSQLFDVDVISEPWKAGNRYFFVRRVRGEEQPVLMMREGSSATEVCLVDPNERAEGTGAAIGILGISDNGQFLAYCVRQGGDDAYGVEFVDVDQRRILPDRLPYGYCTGLVFSPTNAGFFYSHLLVGADRSRRRSVRFHEFGTDFEKDSEVFSVEGSERFQLHLFSISNGRILGYLVSWLRNSPCCDFYIHEISKNKPPTLIANKIEGRFCPIGVGDPLIVLTDWQAPNFRILALEPTNPEESNWRELIPETNHQIHGCAVAGGQIFVCYVENCNAQVEIFDRNGAKCGVLPCPEGGTVQLLPRSIESDTLFCQFTSFSQPPEILAYRTGTGTSEVWAKSLVPFDPSSIEVRRVAYSSKDGTEIPMYLIWRKGRVGCGATPAFLTGYGGFGASITPRFAVYATVLIELGFTVAIANLRGGAEFGRKWHEAGKRHNRQNAIDDFIAAAEWLLAKKYTTPEKLAIGGGSNAGLLVAAAMTQRPELFRAVLCQGPLLDMLRYHKFDLADLWIDEYGSADIPEDFPHLNAYSPYHNVKTGTAYPATMLISGDADQRCNPMHARKMAARLQAATSARHPILLDYRSRWGHSPAQSLTERIEALTDKLAFVCNELEVEI